MSVNLKHIQALTSALSTLQDESQMDDHEVIHALLNVALVALTTQEYSAEAGVLMEIVAAEESGAHMTLTVSRSNPSSKDEELPSNVHKIH